MRAPEESWEQPFLEFQEMVDAKYAKEYPADFVERQVAHAAKLEAEAGGRDDDDAPVAVAATTDDSGFDKFYAIDDAADDDSEVGGGCLSRVFGWWLATFLTCGLQGEEVANTDFQPLPRETHADKINDKRSLDRRLQDRLILLVQRASDGKWTLPQVGAFCATHAVVGHHAC